MEFYKNKDTAKLWEYFFQICKIPHGSGNEKKLLDFIIDIAQKNGLKYKQDSASNLVVIKEGKDKQKPSIACQCHVDMVCEKNKDISHDFENDEIIPVQDGDWIKASGTTLGADNGIGVAAALALMEDKRIEYGDLEFLFTVEEEAGLIGAKKLESGFIKSKIFLNLDTEEDHALYVGCAGGQNTFYEFPLKYHEEISGELKAIKISIEGLLGGHSGLNINDGRANAIKLLSRILWQILEKSDTRLSRFDGGNKRNAIPREAEMVVGIPQSDIKKVRDLVQSCILDFQKEFPVEKGLNVKFDEISAESRMFMTFESTRKFSDFIMAIPNGVIAMSKDIDGLVETSTNLGVVTTKEESISIVTAQRSSFDIAMKELKNRMASIARLADIEFEQPEGYPGWQPNMDSMILNHCIKVHEKLFGTKPAIKAVHAGLECGIIGEKFKGIDMVSLGPEIKGAHSPDERVYIPSVDNFWKFLVEIVRAI